MRVKVVWLWKVHRFFKIFHSKIHLQWVYDAIITSLWRRNDVTTSFWRHNDVNIGVVIISSYARWVLNSIVCIYSKVVAYNIDDNKVSINCKCSWHLFILGKLSHPANTKRNTNVIMTWKCRFHVIIMFVLRSVFDGHHTHNEIITW